MERYTKVTALYFSPTHTTKKVVEKIAASLAEMLGIECDSIDITTPESRKKQIIFNSNNVVIFGSPVYIGRLPNLISPYFKTFAGNGATAVAVVVLVTGVKFLPVAIAMSCALESVDTHNAINRNIFFIFTSFLFNVVISAI